MVKCGYVSVIGRPNAGKSSLLNWLIGEKLVMVSHKANATRKRSNIIMMYEDNQIIFVDTPGLHETQKLLNQFMVDEALKAIGDCDLALFLAPVTDNLKHYESFLEKSMEYNKDIKHIILLTKIDNVKNKELIEKIDEYKKYDKKYEAIIPISIKRSTTSNHILNEVIKHLPTHPYLYDTEIITTETLRDIFKGFIQEAIFENISDEIPYETDVIIQEVKEKANIDLVKATIIVQKSSQKGMIIGKGATAIKRIGKSSRLKIEQLTKKKCFLELFVRVEKGWTKDKKSLKKLGYDISF